MNIWERGSVYESYMGRWSRRIAPGFLDTARIDMLRDEGRWEKRLASIPLGRPGTPEEVAELVRYLCGPHARWISGEVILMNGGEVRRAAN